MADHTDTDGEAAKVAVKDSVPEDGTAVVDENSAGVTNGNAAADADAEVTADADADADADVHVQDAVADTGTSENTIDLESAPGADENIPEAKADVTVVLASEPMPVAVKDELEQPPQLKATTTTAPTSTSKQDHWTLMLNHLIAYKAQHNSTTVPKRYKERPSLGVWVETQRAQFKKMWLASGRTDDLLASAPDPTIYVTPNTRLSADRLRRLQEVGFSWFVRKSRGSRASHGGGAAAAGTSAAGAGAAGNKRKSADGASSDGNVSGNAAEPNLKKHRRKDVQWNEMYQRLLKFRNETGHCIVPKGYAEDPKLACWVETQRHLYSKHYSQSDPEPVAAVAATEEWPVSDPASGLESEGVQDGQTATDMQVDTEPAKDDHPTSILTAAAESLADAEKKKDLQEGVQDAQQEQDQIEVTQDVIKSIQDGVTAATENQASPGDAEASAAVLASISTSVPSQDVNMVDAGLGIVNTDNANSVAGSTAEVAGAEFVTPELTVADAVDEDTKAVEVKSGAINKRNVRLTVERKNKLDAIGFVSALLLHVHCAWYSFSSL
jgi:hypothetical protein